MSNDQSTFENQVKEHKLLLLVSTVVDRGFISLLNQLYLGSFEINFFISIFRKKRT